MCSINVGEVECITPSDDVFTGYIGIVGDEQVLQLFKGVSRKCSFAELAVILELFSGADCTEGDGNIPCLSTEAAAIEDLQKRLEEIWTDMREVLVRLSSIQ